MRRTLAAVLLALLVLSACADDEGGTAARQDEEGAVDDQPRDGAGGIAPAEATDLVRDDLDCDPDALGEDEEFAYVAARFVVDGALGASCFGEGSEADAVLLEAWDLLATISPQGQLADLGVFAAVEAADVGDEVTLAFVTAIDPFGEAFSMSINVEEHVADADQAALTLAHEFSHVFTATDRQLDRSDESFGNCDTYDNGEGCYLPDSLLWAWIEAFWPEDLLAEVDPDAETGADEGQDRCDREPGFFGAYAASNPEEDFAEAFAAHVFDVPAATDAQQEKLDWIDAQPGLAEFRDRAVDAGLTPLPNAFDPCG